MLPMPKGKNHMPGGRPVVWNALVANGHFSKISRGLIFAKFYPREN